MIGITIFLLYKALEAGISNIVTMLIFIGFYAVIYLGLEVFLHKTGDKSFENIII